MRWADENSVKSLTVKVRGVNQNSGPELFYLRAENSAGAPGRALSPLLEDHKNRGHHHAKAQKIVPAELLFQIQD